MTAESKSQDAARRRRQRIDARNGRTYLPVEPLRAALAAYVAARPDDGRAMDEISSVGSLAWDCVQIGAAVRSYDSWLRQIHHVLTDYATVELGDADTILLAMGTGETLDMLWPDWEAARIAAAATFAGRAA